MSEAIPHPVDSKHFLEDQGGRVAKLFPHNLGGSSLEVSTGDYKGHHQDFILELS